MIKISLIEIEDLEKIVEWNKNKSADYLLQWAGPMYNYPLTLGVFDFNQGAIKCYENAGFTKIKLIENARETTNGYWNLYEMAISKDMWMEYYKHVKK